MKTYNLKFLNFYTWYSSEGEVNHKMQKEACFSNIFYCRVPNPEKINNKYTIRICYSGKDIANQYSNQCYLSLRDIKTYLNQCKRYVPFEYTITKDENYYYINLTISAPLIAHKFVLTYVRYLYEMPFAVYLYETIKVHKECKELQHLSYLNLYNIISATIPCYDHGTNIHNIGASYKFKQLLTDESIQKFLKTNNDKVLDKLFPTFEDDQLITLDTSLKNTKAWKFKTDRSKRINTYIHNYNIIKNIKQ